MKLIISLCLCASVFNLNALPEQWDVELTAQPPQVFTLQRPRGETYELEAVLKNRGKTFEPAITNAFIYWQTNGMENLYWSAPASVSNNVLRATWLPSMDPGAAIVRGYIGDPGHVYAAAFQFRFIASPGSHPNDLPLPTPVIDLSRVTVLNPPWSGGGSGGTNTNDVKAIVDAEVGGTNAVKAAVAAISHLVSATNDLSSSVSGLASSKRDKTDLKITEPKNVHWVWTSDHPNCPDGWLDAANSYGAPKPFYDGDGAWSFVGIGVTSEISFGEGDSLSVLFTLYLTDEYVFTATATRSSATDTTPVEVDSLALASKLPEANQLLTSEQRAALDVLPGEVDEAKSAANDANVWSMATYNFMTGGRTNCWFSGTNYVFGADAATRQKFAWEDGMDAATVPCSMALWEIRDGSRQLVWDQRDWTAWYWSFKAAQMTAEIQGRIDALGNAVTNASNYAWAKRYASDGTPNPDASTTIIDTPSVTLSPGMKWETVATAAGAAYWTIVGNGAVIGGNGTNATLRIQDFEGNDIMTVTKGEHRLAWLERGDITGNMLDEERWVCFDMLADAEPVGHFSTTLDSSDFLPQTDPNCPAQYSWENIGGGKWRVHFLLKPGIQSNACFAKFQVEVEGQTVIRYNAGQEISGGLIYNGVKIAPDISGTPTVGTVIQWKVVR